MKRAFSLIAICAVPNLTHLFCVSVCGFGRGCCEINASMWRWTPIRLSLTGKGQEVAEKYGRKKCQRKCQAAGLCACLAPAVRSYNVGYFRAKLSPPPLLKPQSAEGPRSALENMFGIRSARHGWGASWVPGNAFLISAGFAINHFGYKGGDQLWNSTALAAERCWWSCW